MQVRLRKPELERYVDDQVKAGRFPTPEAVVEDALARMMEEDIPLSDEDIDAINQAEEQIDRGDSVEFDAFATRMRQKHGPK